MVLLRGLLTFGVFACNTPEEPDPYEEAYGRYDWDFYSFRDETTEGAGGNLYFENLRGKLSALHREEKFAFAQSIVTMIGDYIDFSKEGVQFSGELTELVPYERTSVSNHGSGFSMRFERNPSPFPEGKHLSGNLRVGKTSWSGTYYIIELGSIISFDDGFTDENRPEGQKEPFIIFEMRFYKG